MQHYFIFLLWNSALAPECFLVTLRLRRSDSCRQLFFSLVSKRGKSHNSPSWGIYTRNFPCFCLCHCSREGGEALNPSSAIELLRLSCQSWPVTQDAKGQDYRCTIQSSRWGLDGIISWHFHRQFQTCFSDGRSPNLCPYTAVKNLVILK